MGLPDDFAPAPGRGQYDRSQTREQRLSEQRDRLLAATARILADQPAAGVAAVIELAGVGRGTFYEYFDDVEHARAAAVAAALRRLDHDFVQAEGRARTPVERFRALAAAWFDFALREPASLLIALREEPRDAETLSAAGAAFEAALARCLDALAKSRMAPAQRDALRLTAAAAVAEAMGRRIARAALRSKDAALGARTPTERALVDALVLLLR
jgi:AcrR family transcriptional regulator